MKQSCHQYNTLSECLHSRITGASKPPINNLALFVFALVMTGHSHLPKIAIHMPVAGHLKNALQRLERFLKNKAIQPTQWYKGVARAALALFAGTEIALIMDQTDLGDRFPMLFVAVGFRKRAIPILWTMLPHPGCSGCAEQKKLLTQVARLLPPNTRIVLYADREYGSAPLVTFLHNQGWSLVIRMKKERWCQLPCGRRFQLQEVPLHRGTVNFESWVSLKELPDLRLSLSCGWSSLDPKDEPWYLLSNWAAGYETWDRYGRRFWIEEMFRDFKEQGFRLDKTHLECAQRVSILVMCVCIAYTWTLLLGVDLEKAGKRKEVDRATKPQLSLFQFVFRYLRRCFARREEMPRYFRLSTS